MKFFSILVMVLFTTLIVKVQNGRNQTGVINQSAEVSYLPPCQTITPKIDSTNPVASGAGTIQTPVGGTVGFNGSATFSIDATGATYSWDFGDGTAIMNGLMVSHVFNTAGTFTATFIVKDTNPLGCTESVQINIEVLNQLLIVNNSSDIESSFDPEQLISEVLVSGGCSSVDNFSYQVYGNPSDTNTKSYGYFRKGGAIGFPFDEGVVLTTGRAFKGGNFPAVGNPDPTFDNSQPGDKDLEAALNQTDTNDATFIKFNFTPAINSIRFSFIMASEEYDGTTECNFADSFAFLLREAGTTTYTNLAVLPDGITPISVTNINNSNGCRANSSYFAGYNLSDTNYGGRTVKLNAYAEVIANTTYEIKLVVADQGDSIWDSAIFLEAGSFNLGGDLGNDRTIDSGNAPCQDSVLTLDTGVDPTLMHTWYFNGVEILGESSSTISIEESGMYAVDIEFSPSCISSDNVLVEFGPVPTIQSVIDLSECKNTTDPVIFDLTENESLAIGSQDPTKVEVSFHNSQEDAEMATNAISGPDVYAGSDEEMIYIRIQDVQSGNCYSTDVFTLFYLTIDLNTAPNMRVCDDNSNDGMDIFDLTTQNSEILGAQNPSFFTITYHESQIDADNGLAPLPSSFKNTSNPQIIYVRVEDNRTGCYRSSSHFEISVVDVNPILTAEVITLAFSNQHNIQVIANTTASSSIALYEFSLDDGPWVINTVKNNTYTFINTSAGEHTIYLRDLYGCSTDRITIVVMDYLPYFTPNGDGYNDFWKIYNIQTQPDAVIYIYDRYGKLLKQLSPTAKGWDGTYNNQPMPTSDYWFTVDYREPNTEERKTFKSHFTLKR